MAETPTNAKDALRVAGAAALSGLSRKAIYKYLSEGRLMRHGLRRVPIVSRGSCWG
jgi:predicted DNA-binding transcriptional regulator AlpA